MFVELIRISTYVAFALMVALETKYKIYTNLSFQGLKIISSFQGMRDSPWCFQGLVLHLGTSRLPVSGRWHRKVLDFLSACSVLHYFPFSPLVVLVTWWWWLSHFLSRQMNSAQRSASLCTTVLRVSARVRIPTQVCLAPNLAFSPITLCSVFELHSRFYGSFCYFFCHFSEVRFPLLQLHKRPITPASDLFPLIGFPMAMAPFQRLLLSAQGWAPRRHWQSGSRSFQLLVSPPSQPKLLISNLSAIHHLPALNSPFASSPPISEACKSQLWKLSKHQGRVETLLPGLVIGLWGKFHWDSPNKDYLWTT